jgi:hypothetical protein
MITDASNPAAVDATGPVTAEERAARWGHHCGVLELNGPVEVIDRIERSLFVCGAITARIEVDDAAFGIHAGMVETLIKSKVLAGMVALIVTLTGGDTLTARAEGEQIELNASDAIVAVTAVQELLARSGILLASGNADWEI